MTEIEEFLALEGSDFRYYKHGWRSRKMISLLTILDTHPGLSGCRELLAYG